MQCNAQISTATYERPKAALHLPTPNQAQAQLKRVSEFPCVKNKPLLYTQSRPNFQPAFCWLCSPAAPTPPGN